MLSEKDRKHLAGIPTNIYLLCMAVLLTAMLIFAVGCAQNMYLAKIIGSVEGYSFVDIANLWISDIDLKKTYSGVYITAINRFELALLDLGVVFIIGANLWLIYTIRNRNRRIVRAFIDCGVW